jgi:hypothetical protein
MRIYIDTSIINGLYAEDIDVKIATEKFFEFVQKSGAVVYSIPILVSWNFEHIVKLKTKVEINRINREHGYPQIGISSPQEV